MKQISFFLFFFSISLAGNAQEIVSPNKNIKVVVSVQKASANENAYPMYKVLYKKGSKYIEVIKNSPLGISRRDQQFTGNLTLVSESKIKEVHDKYAMICGKRKNCENFGREKTFSYKNPNDQPLDIVFRVYNAFVSHCFSSC